MGAQAGAMMLMLTLVTLLVTRHCSVSPLNKRMAAPPPLPTDSGFVANCESLSVTKNINVTVVLIGVCHHLWLLK